MPFTYEPMFGKGKGLIDLATLGNGKRPPNAAMVPNSMVEGDNPAGWQGPGQPSYSLGNISRAWTHNP